MAMGSKGLGRGLDALLGGVKEDEAITSDSAEVRLLPIDIITPNPHQPRREFSEDALKDLAASIATRGVLQPVLVRPLDNGKYELIAGERRLRASKLAGLTDIPTLLRDMTDQESLAIALIENLQREDLNAVEEALGYQQLQQQFGLSQDELARQVGKSRSAVANALRLLNLPESVQHEIQQGGLSAGHGRAIMAVSDADVQAELHKRINDTGMTVRQAEAQASFWKQNGHLPGADEVGKTANSKKPGKAPAQPLSPELEAIQDRLRDSLNVKVSISGSSKKGKITLTYTDEESLRNIVDTLG